MASVTGDYQVGITIRGHVKRELQKFCTQMGYELELREIRYWLNSALSVKIICPDDHYDFVQIRLDEFIDHYREVL
jgi:hypothetical protein